jgi:hypothetical protein
MRTESSRWVRAFLFGILAELAIIAIIIAVVQVHKHFVATHLSPEAYEDIGRRVGAIVGMTVAPEIVFVAAWPIVRSVTKHKIIHGLLVAIGAISLQLGGSLAGHAGLPMGYAYAVVLKLIAGAAAGYLAWRVPIRATV